MNVDANANANASATNALSTAANSRHECVRILQERVTETLSLLSRLSPEEKERMAELVTGKTRYITRFGNPSIRLDVTATVVQVGNTDYHISESFNTSVFIIKSDAEQSGLISLEEFVDLTDIDKTQKKVLDLLQELDELQLRAHAAQQADDRR